MSNYDELYIYSINELKKYLKSNRKIPSEQVWNKYAVNYNVLSSKSIEYGYNKNFNKMCRELIKEINKNRI